MHVGDCGTRIDRNVVYMLIMMMLSDDELLIAYNSSLGLFFVIP